MLKEIYIVFSDHNGDTALGITAPVSSHKLEGEAKALFEEPYALMRLYEEAKEGLKVKAELMK